jgi:hypothetical protein
MEGKMKKDEKNVIGGIKKRFTYGEDSLGFPTSVPWYGLCRRDWKVPAIKYDVTHLCHSRDVSGRESSILSVIPAEAGIQLLL